MSDLKGKDAEFSEDPKPESRKPEPETPESETPESEEPQSETRKAVQEAADAIRNVSGDVADAIEDAAHHAVTLATAQGDAFHATRPSQPFAPQPETPEL